MNRCRRRRAAATGGRSSSRRSRSSHRSRSGGGRRQQGTGGRQSSHRSRSPGRHRHRAGRHQSGSLTAEEEARAGQIQVWQHGQSFLFASLGVVLGMFSLNRFVILTLDFGGELTSILMLQKLGRSPTNSQGGWLEAKQLYSKELKSGNLPLLTVTP